jgi:hypothetical protein
MEKQQYRGKLGSAWAERRAVQLERDGKLIECVNANQVLTRELGCALLGWPRTPANLKTVERRLRRLADDGKECHQVSQDGIVYTLSPAISPRKQEDMRQLAHRYMQARVWSVFRVVQYDERYTDSALRTMHLPIVPDGFVRFAHEGLFFETNTGKDNYSDVVKKAGVSHLLHIW